MQKRTTYFVFSLLFGYLICRGQNLVLNYSFENYGACPPGTITLCSNWTNPNTSSPDYFNACASETTAYSTPWNFAGYQIPYDGNGYAGLFFFDKLNPNSREYITGQLSSPLVAGKKYYVSYMANLATYFGYSVSTLGAYFTVSQPYYSNYYYWPVTPQIENTSGNINDSLNWVLIADTFTASGGEQYITIGNFRPDSLSDTLNLYASPYYYYSAYYYIDAVTVLAYDQVGTNEAQISKTDFRIYPNPATGWLKIEGFGLKENAQFEILSMEGRLMKKFKLGMGSQTLTIETSDLESGVYLLKVIQNGKLEKTEKLMILNNR